MEALVAVGLASNVLQFVDFATKLVSKAGELQKDLASSDHKDYDAIAAHLQTLAEKVKDSARSVAQSSATVSPEEKALQPLADGCCELANKLSRRLYRLGLSSAQSGSILRRGKAAWRWVWNKKETEEIVERLHYFGSQLAFHMTYQIKQNQLGQASKDDTQAVLRRTNEVLLSIEGLRLSIHEKLDKQHKDVLESIANVEAVNRQLQAQTTHEMSLASQATSKGIHDLGTSLSTLMLKQNEDMRASKSEILESLATIRVENSELHSRATQVLPYTRDFDSASLRHLLGSMLDEYNENIILGIRKEFRSTALRDMESMRTQALHALDGMQPETKTRVSMAQSAPEPAAEPSSPESSMLTQATIDTEGDALKSRDNIRQKKKNITLVYAYYQLIETRIGTLSFIIRDRVVFDPVKPPVSVYELTAHFTPSPQWCSKGLLVTYEKVTDARGTPRLGFQLEPYRILDNEHKVWEVIYEHDIDSLRCMLAERVISPNDRDSDGKTLLMEAIQCGRLDLVKALVHSGADINATDCLGMSPICWAILFDLDKLNGAFHYLQGLSNVNLSNLWLNDSLIYHAAASFMNIRKDVDIHDIKIPLSDWTSVCRAVDLDLDVPGEIRFLELIIHVFLYKLPLFNSHHFILDRKTAFDLLLDEVVNTCPAINPEIPISYAARVLIINLHDALERGHIAKSASSSLCVLYHGYYVSEANASSLNFLEHVITRAIAQRSDCIFDTYGYGTLGDATLCALFKKYGIWALWADILEDNGFDPDWVKQEDAKRRDAMTAETSTHEVRGDVNAAQALKIKRRKGFANVEE